MGGHASGGKDGLAWPSPGAAGRCTRSTDTGFPELVDAEILLEQCSKSMEPTQLRSTKYTANTAEIYG